MADNVLQDGITLETTTVTSITKAELEQSKDKIISEITAVTQEHDIIRDAELAPLNEKLGKVNGKLDNF